MEFLAKNGANLTIKFNTKDLTALHFAALRGLDDIVDVLLKNGANANITNSNGLTPLHIVAMRTPSGHEKTAKILLKFGANIEMKSNSGLTPVQLAEQMSEYRF